MEDFQPKLHLTQNHANDLTAYYCYILRGSVALQGILSRNIVTLLSHAFVMN